MMLLHCCLIRSKDRLHRPSEAGTDYGCSQPAELRWTTTTIGQGWDRTE